MWTESRNILASKLSFGTKNFEDVTGSTAVKRKAFQRERRFRQPHSINYEQTYASDIRLTSIPCQFSIVAHSDLDLHWLYVITAILISEVEVHRHMKVPYGVQYKTQTKTVCILLKVVNGLKHTPRRQNFKIEEFPKIVGFGASLKTLLLYSRVQGYQSNDSYAVWSLSFIGWQRHETTYLDESRTLKQDGSEWSLWK